MIDKKAIEEHIRGILIALGDDPDREGLAETPERVARMYEEVFAKQAIDLISSNFNAFIFLRHIISRLMINLYNNTLTYI